MINPGNSQKEKAMDEVAAPEQQDLTQDNKIESKAAKHDSD